MHNALIMNKQNTFTIMENTSESECTRTHGTNQRDQQLQETHKQSMIHVSWLLVLKLKISLSWK